MKKFITISLMILSMFMVVSCGKKETKKELPMSISQEDWNSYRQYVQLSTGIKMAYVEMGNPDGEVIILQHGMTDNSRSWSLAAPYFTAQGYHVYLPDLRGMGQSDAPDGYYNAMTYATDLEAFFDAMNIDKAVLVGHSLGSFTVQSFYLMFPERCNKIVLVSSIPLKNYQNDALESMYNNYIKNLPDDGHLSDAFMEVWYGSVLQEPEFSDVFPTFLSNMKKEAQVLSKKAWVSILMGMLTHDFEGVYDCTDINIPTLILHGDDDTMTKLVYQDELCEIFNVDSNSYKNYIGVGHNIQFEMPKTCATDILNWLKTGSLN